LAEQWKPKLGVFSLFREENNADYFILKGKNGKGSYFNNHPEVLYDLNPEKRLCSKRSGGYPEILGKKASKKKDVSSSMTWTWGTSGFKEERIRQDSNLYSNYDSLR